MPGGFNFGGMPSGGSTRTFHFTTSGGPGGFTFSNPEDIFAQFAKGAGAGKARGTGARADRPCRDGRAYSDADWAGNADDRKSTSGGCFYVGNNLVSR